MNIVPATQTDTASAARVNTSLSFILAPSSTCLLYTSASEQGTIKVIAPTRGDKKTMKKILEVMRSDGYRGGLAYIDHVDNVEGAEELGRAIASEWPQAEVEILPCRGLCSLSLIHIFARPRRCSNLVVGLSLAASVRTYAPLRCCFAVAEPRPTSWRS